ncbi:MAG: hypothetical protein JW969_00240 [Spirochaetales bacterium]|nr:hypothetical protein [Spirochaetales bacterium]
MDQKRIYIDYFNKQPNIDIEAYLRTIPVLSDKIQCIFHYENWKKSLGPIESLKIMGLKSKIYKTIVKQGENIFKEIIRKNRNGKTFDDIILEKMVPLFIENDNCVLDELIKHFYKLLESSTPLRKVHSALINDIIRIYHIVQYIKEKDASEESVKDIIRNNIDSFKGHARFLLFNILREDPYFKSFTIILKDLIASIDDTDQVPYENMPDRERNLLQELKEVKTVEEFVEIADKAIFDCRGYVSQVYEQFELLLNAPLIKIYKILRFNGNKQLFYSWIKEAPLPVREFSRFEKELNAVKGNLKENSLSISVPGDYESLVALLYDQKLDFTDKYKLLYKAMTGFEDQDVKAFISQALNHIKTMQFPIEKKFLSGTIDKLKETYVLKDITDVFENEKKSVDAKLRQYKKQFRDNIKMISENACFDLKKVFPDIIDMVKREKLLSQALLAFLDEKVSTGKPSKLTVDIVNFLNSFYIILNYRLVLDFWKEYFTSLKNTDGIFLKTMLSCFTHENLYDIYMQFPKGREAVLEQFKTLLLIGEIEREIRLNFFKRLVISREEIKEMKIGKYTVTMDKYAQCFTIVILDEQGKLLYTKPEDNINCYLDFLESVKAHRIRTFVTINDRQLKCLYQRAHIERINRLMVYIRRKIALLCMDDFFSQKSIEDFRGMIEEPVNTEILKDMIKKGREEYFLRRDILLSLKAEYRERGPKNEKRLSRISREIREQAAPLNRIDTLFKELKKWALEQNNEIARSLTDLELPFLSDVEEDVPERGMGEESLNLFKGEAALTKERIESVLMNNRVKENILVIKRLKKKLGDEAGSGENAGIEEFLRTVPELDALEIEDEIFYTKYKNAEEAEKDVRNNIDNIEYLRDLGNKCEEEVKLREEYIHKHEKLDKVTVSILYYENELKVQKEILELLREVRDFCANRVSKFL